LHGSKGVRQSSRRGTVGNFVPKSQPPIEIDTGAGGGYAAPMPRSKPSYITGVFPSEQAVDTEPEVPVQQAELDLDPPKKVEKKEEVVEPPQQDLFLEWAATRPGFRRVDPRTVQGIGILSIEQFARDFHGRLRAAFEAGVETAERGGINKPGGRVR
jgi:hypothetical protein